MLDLHFGVLQHLFNVDLFEIGLRRHLGLGRVLEGAVLPLNRKTESVKYWLGVINL